MGAARELVGQDVDRYRILAEIGQGGFGAVYRARHAVLDTEVALKVLWPERAEDPVHVERFLREARAAASIGSPRIVSVLDAGTTPEGLVFLAMELLEGADLAARLERDGVFELPEALRLTRDVLEGLSAAHERGIVHRDLKPANVFVTSRGEVKLLDFGISKVLGEASLTGTGMALGTPQSMAPEQLEGRLQVDARADVYAVGCLLYQLLAGCPPYDGEGYAVLVRRVKGELPVPLRERRPLVPPEFAFVVHRALALDRDARWPDAASLAEALAAAARGVAPQELGGTQTLPPVRFVSPAATPEAVVPRTLPPSDRPASGAAAARVEAASAHPSGVRAKRREPVSSPSGAAIAALPTQVAAQTSPLGCAALGGLAVLLALGLGVLGVLGYRYSHSGRQPVRVIEPLPPPPSGAPAAPGAQATPVAPEVSPPSVDRRFAPSLPGDPSAVRFESLQVAGFVDRGAVLAALEGARGDFARCAEGPAESRAPAYWLLNGSPMAGQNPDQPSDRPAVTACVVRVLEGLYVPTRSPTSITLTVVVPPSGDSTAGSESE